MTSRVLVSLRVKTNPERAFAVFTREIGAWWSPNGLFQLTPRGDGTLSFEGGEGGRLITTLPGGKVYEVGRITVWAPPYRLVFGWRPAGVPEEEATEVEVNFEAVGEEVRVSVEHRGWDAVPQNHVARHGFPLGPFQMRAAEWWREELEGMRALIHKSDCV